MTQEISNVALVEQVLADAAKFEQEMRADSRFTDQYKGQAIQERYAEAKATAKALAERFVAEAAQVVLEAEAQYNAAAVEYAGTIDNQRQSVTHTEAQVLASTAGTYSQVEAKVLQAIQRRDVAMLNSMKDVAIPLLVQRAGQSDLSPLHGDRGALLTLGRTIDEALAELEPASLKNARKALQAAQQAHHNVTDGLATINFRHAMRTGGAGPLAAHAGVFVPDHSGVKIKFNQSAQPWPN